MISLQHTRFNTQLYITQNIVHILHIITLLYTEVYQCTYTYTQYP